MADLTFSSLVGLRRKVVSDCLISFSSAPSMSSEDMESTSEPEDGELEEDELEFELNEETLDDRRWWPLPLVWDPRPLCSLS